MSTREALLRVGTKTLEAAGVPDPARDARLLLRWAANVSGAGLVAVIKDQPSPEEAARYGQAIRCRATREPLSHITGTREFYGRLFEVGPEVLDPRPETEVLVGEALHRGPFQKVLDLGTGSGCILLSLLAEWPDAMGTGVDTSAAALEIAKRNARALGVSERCDLRQGDWLAGLDGDFDLVVSNPPYIAEAEMADLEPEVRDHEPRGALTPGGDGLEAYRVIARDIRRVLCPGGWLMVEIGSTQAEAVAGLLASNGLLVRGILPDLDQRARVTTAQA